MAGAQLYGEVVVAVRKGIGRGKNRGRMEVGLGLGALLAPVVVLLMYAASVPMPAHRRGRRTTSWASSPLLQMAGPQGFPDSDLSGTHSPVVVRRS